MPNTHKSSKKPTNEYKKEYEGRANDGREDRLVSKIKQKIAKQRTKGNLFWSNDLKKKLKKLKKEDPNIYPLY